MPSSRPRARTPSTVALAFAFGFASAVANAQTAHPQIPIYDAATINGSCDQRLDDYRAMQKKMEAVRGPGRILDEWNALSLAVSEFDGPLSITANTSPDKATRDAAEACELKLDPFSTELFQSESLYARVKAFKPADAIQASYRKKLVESFEDTGVTLPTEKRARAKAINQQLSELRVQFEQNIRDDGTRVVFTPAEMAGMPDAYLAAQKKDAQGNYVLTLAYPSYVPFLTLASNGDARKRYWIAKNNEGSKANLDLLDRAVALRLELARLYGDPDYATYVLKRRMAKTPDAAYRFLGDVKAAVSDLEKKEIDELRQLKADDLKQAVEQTTLNRWDLAYYQEKLKKARFDVDQEALRKYFPAEASIAYTLKVSETLYGIRFAPSNAPTWHPDVRVYDVYEQGGANGKAGPFIATVYLDLFPRDGKYKHAAAWRVRPVSTLAKEKGAPGYHTPISALVTNFDRNGFDQGELETMLHEFGHTLHGVLSKVRYADQAGTSVQRDFVEAPSQMFEEWARREDALKLFAEVCRDCPQLTSRQIAQMDAARKYGRGILYARQVAFSEFDLSLTTPHPDGALASWQRIEGAQPLGHVPGTIFPAGFGHLMGGYAAGYYGYMWSQVLALDMLSGFHGKLMNPVDGRRYRTDILSRGGEVPPEQLVERFLGRKPSSEAFFKEIVGAR